MDVAGNLSLVRERISAACARVGRDSSEVELLAVTKGFPPEVVDEAARASLTLFGENKVQEAKAKIPLCSSRLRWQMIGHLQSNKAREAVHLFEMIQSVDSISLAGEISKWAEKLAKTMPILVEVNVAGESSKFGCTPERLLADIAQINALPRIELRGLMTVAPWTPDLEKVRDIFRRLRELKLRCEKTLSGPLPHLSMGMSGDFEVAIEEGATIIRLGSVLFGDRPKKVSVDPL
jgi:pyridoxal phosphate enzyme (YggS family)